MLQSNQAYFLQFDNFKKSKVTFSTLKTGKLIFDCGIVWNCNKYVCLASIYISRVVTFIIRYYLVIVAHIVAKCQIRVSIVVSIPACHAGDRGSIPRHGDLFSHFIQISHFRSTVWYCMIDTWMLSVSFALLFIQRDLMSTISSRTPTRTCVVRFVSRPFWIQLICHVVTLFAEPAFFLIWGKLRNVLSVEKQLQ